MASVVKHRPEGRGSVYGPSALALRRSTGTRGGRSAWRLLARPDRARERAQALDAERPANPRGTSIPGGPAA